MYPGCDYYESTAELTDRFVHPYSIITQPGRHKTWAEERAYKNADILGLIVSVGNTVFVRVEQDKDVEPLPEDPTPQEQLAYDQQYAVAQVLEIRASSRTDVWMLVAYFYWPKELEPASLRHLPRWEDGELILSNHLQIISVTNLDYTADLVYWDHEGKDVADRPDLFWRYTFRSDLCRKTKNPDVLLSRPRAYCQCGIPGSATRVLSTKCSNPECGARSHEDCIVESIGKRAYEAYKQERMDEFAQTTDQSLFTSLATRVVDAVRDAAAAVSHSVEAVVEDGIAAIAAESLVHAKVNDEGGEEEEEEEGGGGGGGENVVEEYPTQSSPSPSRGAVAVTAEAAGPSQSKPHTKTGAKSKSESEPKSKTKLKRKAKSDELGWRQIFDIELLSAQDAPGATTAATADTSEIAATAETVQPNYIKLRERSGQKREWTVRARCLVCGRVN